jgi:hypothetical protein
MAEFYLCSLRILEEGDHSLSSLKVKSPSYHNSDTILTSLLENYQDKFKEPEGLPPPDHVIPLKEMSQTINL